MAIIIPLIVGCSSDTDNLLNHVQEIKTSKELVNDYVKNNTYIDIDVDALVHGIVNPKSRAINTEEDMAKMKAAVYRFYENVSVENGYYKCNIPNGSAINISQEVYSALLDNLNLMNEVVKKSRDKGEKVDIQVPDQEYLNSLLE